MELWIKSQDKKNLIKVNALYTDIPDDFGKDGFGVYCDKRDSYVSNTLLKIGQYKSKQRALEVLDEIQEKILKIEETSLMVNPLIIEECVYVMPQE